MMTRWYLININSIDHSFPVIEPLTNFKIINGSQTNDGDDNGRRKWIFKVKKRNGMQKGYNWCIWYDWGAFIRVRFRVVVRIILRQLIANSLYLRMSNFLFSFSWNECIYRGILEDCTRTKFRIYSNLMLFKYVENSYKNKKHFVCDLASASFFNKEQKTMQVWNSSIRLSS